MTAFISVTIGFVFNDIACGCIYLKLILGASAVELNIVGYNSVISFKLNLTAGNL